MPYIVLYKFLCITVYNCGSQKHIAQQHDAHCLSFCQEHYDTLSQIKRVYLFHDESGPHLDAQFFEDNHIDRPHQQLFRAALERGLSRLDRAVSAVSATSELPEKEGPATAGDAANAGSAAMDAATEAASDAWKKEWSKEDWWRWNNWSPGWNTWSSGWNTWSSGWNSW